MLIGKIIVDIASSLVDKVFDYILPDESFVVGMRVYVPFGKVVKEGYLIDICDRSSYDESKLKNVKLELGVNSTTNLEDSKEYSNLDKLKEVSYYMSDPNKVDVDNPLIYIYNSHQGETYSMKYLEEYNITPNVLMASRMLSEKLNNVGIFFLILGCPAFTISQGHVSTW